MMMMMMMMMVMVMVMMVTMMTMMMMFVPQTLSVFSRRRGHTESYIMYTHQCSNIDSAAEPDQYPCVDGGNFPQANDLTNCHVETSTVHYKRWYHYSTYRPTESYTVNLTEGNSVTCVFEVVKTCFF